MRRRARIAAVLAAPLAFGALSLPYLSAASAQVPPVQPPPGVAASGNGITVPDWYTNTLTAPHVPDNATLAAKSAANYPQGIWRDHHAAGGFADGPVFFDAQTGTCAANSLVNDGGGCVDGAGGNSWKASFTRLNVKAFGALGNNGTDDGPAINKAFDYCRATQAGLCEIEFPNPKGAASYVIATPVNCTNFRNSALRIVFNGAWITGKTSGAPVFDCLKSFGVYFDNLRMTSVSGAQEPSIGVQIGRSAASESSGGHVFKDAYVNGPFTQAPLLNEQAEGTTFIGSIFINTDPAAARYGAILDGVNHWNVASNYLTVTLPVDSAGGGSFTANVFIGGEIAVGGTTPAGSALFMQHVQDIKFEKTFFTDCFNGSIGAQPNIVIRYAGLAAEVLYNLDFDGQMECGTSDFQFTSPGGVTSVTVQGLRYHEAIEYATGSVFSKAGSLTAVNLYGLNFSMAQNNHSAPMFDTAAAYSVSGDVYLPPGSTALGSPAAFWGRETIGLNSGPGSVVETVNTVSGTYTPTPLARETCVRAIGGGGAGGGGARTASGTAASGGAGGGGGGRAEKCYVTSSLGASVPFTVGSAGTGGLAATVNSTAGGNGSAGTRSIFGNSATTRLTANGGGGAAGGQINAAAGAPAGGGTGLNCGTSASSTTTSTNAAGSSPCQSSLTGGVLLDSMGGAGANGANGAAGVQGGFASLGPSGGGSGAGIAATPADTAGGNSGDNAFMPLVGGAAAGANNGTAGSSVPGLDDSGIGGSGAGFGVASGNGGTGGVGGQCGGPGGGGASALNGHTAGAGGNGATGCIVWREKF